MLFDDLEPNAETRFKQNTHRATFHHWDFLHFVALERTLEIQGGAHCALRSLLVPSLTAFNAYNVLCRRLTVSISR